MSFLFYIPSDSALKKIGTSIYKIIGDNDDRNIMKHYSKKETSNKFYKVTTLPFIPNSLLIFPRTNNSYHGVEEINIEAKERNILQINYNEILQCYNHTQ